MSDEIHIFSKKLIENTNIMSINLMMDIKEFIS